MTAPDRADVDAAVAHVREIHAWRAGGRRLDYGDDAIATLLAELKEAEQRFAELSDGMTVAVELLDRLTSDGPCTENDNICRAHGYAHKPCPTALARQVVEAWRAVQAESARNEQEAAR